MSDVVIMRFWCHVCGVEFTSYVRAQERKYWLANSPIVDLITPYGRWHADSSEVIWTEDKYIINNSPPIKGAKMCSKCSQNIQLDRWLLG